MAVCCLSALMCCSLGVWESVSGSLGQGGVWWRCSEKRSFSWHRPCCPNTPRSWPYRPAQAYHKTDKLIYANYVPETRAGTEFHGTYVRHPSAKEPVPCCSEPTRDWRRH